MDKPADNKQKTLIHLARAQLAIAEEAYRAMLGARYHVGSSKDLSYRQADDLINYFVSLGFKIRTNLKPMCSYMCEPRPRGIPLPPNVLVMVSPQQMRKIEHLVEDIHWRSVDGFSRWLKKYHGIDKIKYSLEASRVMEGLKGMWKSQNKCNCKKKEAL